MTSNETKLAAVLTELHATAPETLHLYSAYSGCKAAVSRLEAAAVLELTYQGGHCFPMADSDAAESRITGWLAGGGGRNCQTLASINAGILAMENDVRLAPALALIAPLVAEIARLRAVIAAEAQEVAQRLQDLTDAEAAATAAAMAKAHSSAPVQAARKALLDAGGTLPGNITATTSPADELKVRFIKNDLGELV